MPAALPNWSECRAQPSGNAVERIGADIGSCAAERSAIWRRSANCTGHERKDCQRWRNAACRAAGHNGARDSRTYTGRHQLDVAILCRCRLRRLCLCRQPDRRIGRRISVYAQPAVSKCHRRFRKELQDAGDLQVRHSADAPSRGVGIVAAHGATCSRRRCRRDDRPAACRRYVEGARERLRKRLASEASAP